MSRVLPLLILLACLVAVQPSRADQPDFRLQVLPAIVYKVDDPGNTGTSSFVFDIAASCPADCALTPISASVELSSAGSTIERQDWTTSMLAKIKESRALTPVSDAFELRFYFRNPQAFAIDSADVRVGVADAKGRRAEQRVRIPIQYYQQKTPLIVPFRGNGVVGQDWVTNGGHGGHGDASNEFGLDLRPRDEKGATLKYVADENAASVGWGREIIAPAAGTVTYARNDVPDNPHPGEVLDKDAYVKQHVDPLNAGAGNCVIIDHGNSEYSVMMHMQQGSVTVKVGDRVVAGQVIGKLGNSGGAFGPHVHYQLQSGPQLRTGQGLPFRFQNAPPPYFRGSTFEAK